MSVLEQKSFIKSIHPFEHLSPKELDDFVKNIDIIYLKKDEIIQKKSQKPTHLHFILKGLVQEKNDEDIISVYSKNEIFNPISLIENFSKNTFTAIQECICYILPREIFIKTLHVNQKLESYFFQSISEKLNKNINHEKNQALANIMIAKVKDAKVHKAVIQSNNITIFQAASIIKQEKIPTLLLKDDEDKLYIVTDSDFRQKVILNRMDFDEKISTIASSGLVYIYEDDFLFDAQLIMSKHGLKRLVVKNKEEKIVGILDQISLSSFFSSNTFSISNQIEHAQNIQELKEASSKFLDMIKSLHVKGVKIEFITKLINQLNRKLLDKLYKILTPKQLLKSSSLIVMGSEGRGEQIIKTDQDNAIILSDECDIDENELREFAKNFTETLVDFGFPRCKGNIMVSNPFWCKKISQYKDNIYEWINKPNADNFMNIAIFYDAVCVSGDKNILLELKNYLFKVSNNSDTFYAHFAKVIHSFDVPLGFFDGFVFDSKDKEHKNELDIKRGGIFIIVHSIRSLGIKNQIPNTNTIKRINKLNELNILESEFTKELIMALNFLLNLKLKSHIEKLDNSEEINNYINPKNLTSMEKDLLKDAFKIVNELKKLIEHHFRLNYV